MPAARKDSVQSWISFGDRYVAVLSLTLRQGDVNTQESVQISRFGLAQIVAHRQLQHAFKGAVIDLHDDEAALGGTAPIRPASTDTQTIALDGNLQMFAAHAGQFHLNHETAVSSIHV